MRAFCPPKNTPEKDLVMTPEYLAKDIIEHFKPSGIILDPCRGQGAFYDNFNTETKDWCELDEGKDFLTYNKKVDWIITNPPFNVGKDFALKSLETAKRGVAFLVRFSFLESIKRWEELYSIHKPAKVLIFTRRVGFLPSEVSRNTNSAVPYIWLVWDNKHKGPTEFDWIGHDRDKLEKFGDYPEDNMIFEDHLQ